MTGLPGTDRQRVRENEMAEPLLFLPGLLCDRRLYAAQILALGQGRDIEVADLTHDDGIAAMARRVLAGAPQRFALCGLSMGGYVALEIMRQAPGRVTRLALLDTQARADTPEITARRRGLIELSQKGEFKGVTPRLLPLLLHPDRLKDDGLVATVMAMAEAIGQKAFLRQQQAIMTRSRQSPRSSGDRLPHARPLRPRGRADTAAAERGDGGGHPGRDPRRPAALRAPLDPRAARRRHGPAQDLAVGIAPFLFCRFFLCRYSGRTPSSSRWVISIAGSS